MKKIITSLTAAAMIAASLIPAMPIFAADEISVEVNGTAVDFVKYDNVLPYIENDYTLIPVRAIAENLGLTVSWDEASRTVTAKNADTEITLVIDSAEAKVNGETKTLDIPARITDDRTFIPLRFVSENMGANVDWIADTRTVVIETTSKLNPTDEEVDAVFDKVLKMDTHLHVDVPMEADELPGPEIDLRTAMKNAGMNAVGMTFAVDYVKLTHEGHAYDRFNNSLTAMDKILADNNIERTLNYEQMMENFENGEPIVIQEVEGGHFLEGDVSRIQSAYDRGLRIFCLLHDNDADPPLGDVYTNEPQFGGLTELGAETIKECERLGILVDLAHCDDNTVKMALEVATKPVLISHTGLNTQLGSNEFMSKMMLPRLISAETAKLVADKDGVIGVWPHLADTPEEYAANIKAMVDVVGIDHVCIGTDTKITPEYREGNWGNDEKREEKNDEDRKEDGGNNGFGSKKENAVNHVWDDADDSFYHSVIRTLLAEGFTADDIGKITSGNFCRVFEAATE